MFPNKWIGNWMQEYKVSRRKVNKRFQVRHVDREETFEMYEHLSMMTMGLSF